MHLSPTESSTPGWETPQRICSYQRCLMWSEERTFWKRWRAQGRLFCRAFTHCRYSHLHLQYILTWLISHRRHSSSQKALKLLMVLSWRSLLIWGPAFGLTLLPERKPEPVIDLSNVMSACFEAVDLWYCPHRELCICFNVSLLLLT